MNTTALMQDPFYAPILFQIESRIGAVDRQARGRNISPTDSQIRSILNKVQKTAGGREPNVPRASEREAILASLYDDLLRARAEFRVERPGSEIADLPVRDWVLALRTVEDSIRLRTGGAGSRDYLNFLEGFLQSGQAQGNDH